MNINVQRYKATTLKVLHLTGCGWVRWDIVEHLWVGNFLAADRQEMVGKKKRTFVDGKKVKNIFLREKSKEHFFMWKQVKNIGVKKKRRTSVDVEIKSKEHLLMWKSKEIDADADHLMLMLMGLQMVLIRTIVMDSWKGVAHQRLLFSPFANPTFSTPDASAYLPRYIWHIFLLIWPDI